MTLSRFILHGKTIQNDNDQNANIT
jgi:hypothetical protein